MHIDTAALQIILHPDPRLRQVCKPVDVFDDTVARLTRRMLELMHAGKGIGLAAPQVGVLLRLFVCNVTGEPGDDHIYLNPRLTDLQGHAEDVTGRPFESAGSELLARCWQHEYDHLDGRLILDYMSEADKITNRRPLKQLESLYRPGKTAS
jgi:peptide deformylase